MPYLAHAPMEPLNCLVALTADRCDIWTGTQFQTVDRANAASAAGLKPEQVAIHTLFLGGGFGRRATPGSDFIVEAVHVAKAAEAPVKTIWTREDDLRGGYYRPMWHSTHQRPGSTPAARRWAGSTRSSASPSSRARRSRRPSSRTAST